MGGSLDGSGPALSRRSRWTIAIVPLGFLAVFFLLPLLTILDQGLRPDGRWAPGAIVDVVADEDLRQVIWFTTWQAVVSTVLTLAVGLPGAFVVSRFAFAGRAALRAVLLVPFVLPTVVVGTAFAGPSPSLVALFAAHAFFNLAVVVRVVGGFWSQLDPDLEDAAASLGAPWPRRVTRVLLPLARPAVGAAAALVFLFSFTSFGVALLLAGPSRPTIEVEIYRQTSQLLDLPVASSLAVVQIVVVGAVLLLEGRWSARGAVGGTIVGTTEGARAPRTRGERAFVSAIATALTIAIAAPLVRLAWRSISGPAGLTIARYTDIGRGRRGGVFSISVGDAVATSLSYALVAGAVALVVGVAAALSTAGTRGRAAALLGLPLGVSAVVVGFGYVVAFGRPPLELRGAWWLVPMAQAVVAIPFVIRMTGATLAAIDPALPESAADLGGGPMQVLRDVVMPLIAPAVAGAAAFAFVIALGDFGAAAFLTRADHPTVPVAIVRLLGQPGSASVGQAAALSTILMAITVVVALGLERARAGTLGRL